MAKPEPITVGIPRGLLYHRYGTLWQTYFKTLGINTVVSGPTDRVTAEAGAKAAADEMCLSLKVYLGHVASLIGKCDAVLVPRIVDFGIRRVMCTTFEGLPDIAANVFRDQRLKVLSYNVNVQGGVGHEEAMIAMGRALGFSRKAAKKAWKAGLAAQKARDGAAVERAEKQYKAPGLKIILGAHRYVTEDAYYGRPVIQYLKSKGVEVILADAVDRRSARRAARQFSPTMKWEVSREIAGSIAMHHSRADGIILMSVYPCALDSMVDDMIVRKLKDSGVPILVLTVDAQSGTAGLETRLESFLDILTLRRRAGKGENA
ncbi:acyl-CoA dehydratase activase-related protein [Pseudoramibacter sp.]|uniref:acyl-CoA dehydratase activase-related protein n=1 Tax=Pseudoramibacter sp. TaxID=2034862 RepID=UPI0025DC7A4C|nr:acyl-CoA dehydratase activase-related protein [Pseudoramibacter sp.]MCH4071692.1 acyl-CoA dehydratase activase-related protein [Pseudoramibacter sp.]MCH4105460.1 acyl-CoA dehydratase activase-related protein [Pseudoramibacter sp.]